MEVAFDCVRVQTGNMLLKIIECRLELFIPGTLLPKWFLDVDTSVLQILTHLIDGPYNQMTATCLFGLEVCSQILLLVADMSLLLRRSL